MNIVENYSLKDRNTFGFQVSARYFVEVSSIEQLQQALAFARESSLPCLPLGGGSNLVLTGDIDALVIAVNLRERSVLERTDESVVVRAGAGENWHELVHWTLAEQAYGLENLSLIPGHVGAAPIQNIGAYGVELKDYFESLEAVEIHSGELRRFSQEECQFGYRDSVFKQALRDQFIITSVTFRLVSHLQPKLGYGQLQQELEQRCGRRSPTGMEISEAVADVRMQKLPDPKVLGNAGSFFKNPVVSVATVDRLRAEFPDLVAYPFGAGWKLAAGWLIDKAGLRGYREGRVGTYQHQALVLVNHGDARPDELLELASVIVQKVKAVFGVELEMEPRVY
ncbi:UDP-N-acetylenolpyruvoylglucosamine reductase [Endozoicomonas montiporae]|uniref:UDP-N-acetylenolpyruvoylglucosamine reductase n=2 Tax=Endozoicomonas montiporae TaxID=1027273 RepID=A0A081NA22_9GAMM|nr:UDP-N-acetylmuramate dehydrogenase [Endozoicomonas montiporae]AMO57026.1 UDP-N-acetylenolpyruvoylglucosamine reductase [Endozoicomonas montiporae CL-33]KEQ15295.1 UDP-N-acetylenolpyruvoylglucosamine reductase [Endozoicomonas montiporae]